MKKYVAKIFFNLRIEKTLSYLPAFLGSAGYFIDSLRYNILLNTTGIETKVLYIFALDKGQFLL